MTEDTMADVDHTHPHDDPSVSALFQRGRGRGVVADGSGDATSDDERTTGRDGDEPMDEVDHTPPNGDGANRVFERGRGRSDDRERDAAHEQE